MNKSKQSAPFIKWMCLILHLRWRRPGLWVIMASFGILGTARGQSLKLSGKALPIGEVFHQVKQQTGLLITFDPSDVREVPALQLAPGNYALATVLDKALRPHGLTYSIHSKTIFVAKVALPQKIREKDTLAGTTIRGRVSDPQGKPMQGVSVSLVGTGRGTFTDNNGQYILTHVNPHDAILAFSFIGYRTEKIPLIGKIQADVIMHIEEVSLGIKEVVVSGGYYTVKDREKTGSIARINSKEIEMQPVSNPLASMIGRVPGVNIVQSNGVPGSSFSVQIRGRNSLAQGSEPLFIIDGVPFAPGNTNMAVLTSVSNGLSPFSSISPSDIESIEILKDADATSIYGSRGANGVVLITTKKGKAGPSRLSLRHSNGISQIAQRMKMLSTQQYRELRYEAFRNDQIQPSSVTGTTGFAPDLLLWDSTRYTDLTSLIMGETAQTMTTSFNLSGGSEKTQFLLGGSFNRESTIFTGDSRYRRGSAQFNISHKALQNKLNIGFSANYSLESNNLFNAGALYYSNLPPNLPELYDSTGKLNWNGNGASFPNPIAFTQKEFTSYRKNLISRLQLSYALLENVTIKTALGYNDIHSDEKSFNPLSTQDPQASDYIGYAQYGSNSFSSWIIEPQLDYKLQRGKSKLAITAGGTLQRTLNETQSLKASGYTNDKLLRSLAAAANLSEQSNRYSLYKYAAVFGRLNYILDGKYLVNLSGRRDGSSRFGTENRWGSFYSIGAGWIFSKEKWASDSWRFLSFGKLRASYGTSGNDQIGNYQYLDTWTPHRPYQGTTSLYPASLFNPDYGWELSRKFETALETAWLRDKISFALAYFSNRCGNQLIQYMLPSQTGHFSVNKNFPALIENKGWELELGVKVFEKQDFSWESRWNITLPKNTLLRFDGLQNSAYRAQYVLGEPLNLVYGYQSLGVNVQTGVYEFQDTNKDGTLNSNDFVVSGNLDPKFYGGWSNTFHWKGITLSSFFQFKKQSGTTIINAIYSTPQSFPGMMFNQPIAVSGRWQKPGDITDIQKVSATTSSEAYRAASNYVRRSDAVIGDASFIRLKTLEITYNLPKKFIRKISAQSCNLFFQGQNLWTITRYNGWDPETQGNPLAIPPLRSFNFGLQLDF